ncbi:MAG: hypothetical protein HOI95_18785 [Chromatiales bacterium]|jgi:hypothetical protein|nr:hypothetical protein [Chromatiales bacterium]
MSTLSKRTRIVAGVFVAATFALLTSCAVIVEDSGLSEDAKSYLFYAQESNPKTVFSTTDEKVTLHVRFEYNVVASSQRFRATWYEPSGQAYVAGAVGTIFGSNRDLIVSLKMADSPAARKPGRWRVDLYYKGEIIVEHAFEVK